MTTVKSRPVSMPKSDIYSVEATTETLDNKYIKDQLERSEQGKQKGRIRNLREFLKEL